MNGDLSRDLERYAVVAAIFLLTLGCYLVVRPFLTALLWGGIIAISTHHIYSRVLGLTGGRRAVAATSTALGLTAVLLVPIAALGLNVASHWTTLSERVTAFFSGGMGQPPAWVGRLPLLGKSLARYWQAISAQQSLDADLRPLLEPVRKFLVEFLAGVGAGILEFIVALLIASLLYVWGENLGEVLNQIAQRLGGDVGRRQIAVVESTVRGVFRGVIGTAAVQALLAMIGFWLASVPGAFLLGMATFFLSVVPGGPVLLWLPAALWLASKGETGWAIFMAVWGLVIVGGSDNLVRPLLIGKGVEAPFILIFLGVVGGIFAFGFLGLFIGPTLLGIAYNLVREWIAETKPVVS